MLFQSGIVVSILAFASCQTGTDWITRIERLGEPTSLNCSVPGGEYRRNRDVPADFANYTIRGWMLPNLTIIMGGAFDDGNIQTSPETYTLSIRNTQRNHFGPYYCLTTSPTEVIYMLKLGINVQGPYFEDLWQKYRMNTIIGGAAGGAMLVISALVLLVYRYRYKPDPALEIERKRIERVEKSSVPAFNNKAFEIDSSHIENTHF